MSCIHLTSSLLLFLLILLIIVLCLLQWLLQWLLLWLWLWLLRLRLWLWLRHLLWLWLPIRRLDSSCRQTLSRNKLNEGVVEGMWACELGPVAVSCRLGHNPEL